MPKLVLVHGWALNSGIWSRFTDHLADMNLGVDIQCLDLPGYGRSFNAGGAGDHVEMARYCLNRAPEPAIWVGWSLGGLVAMQAAMLAPSSVLGLQLISTSPKFVEAGDWPEGVDINTFRQFSQQLANNYERALTMFLLMQAGKNRGARDLAKAAHQAVCQWPSPSAETLDAGIRCLASADIRHQLAELHMPIQVISGRRDRVAKPAGSHKLAEMLNSELVELDTGHAPFMTDPVLVGSHLLRLIARVENEY